MLLVEGLCSDDMLRLEMLNEQETSHAKETAGMENETNGLMDTKSPLQNGQPPDPADWAVTDVVNYFKTAGFEEQASVFQDQEIDGKSLLLMTRNDVLTGLTIKLGPALKIYEYHVKALQSQHLKNNAL